VKALRERVRALEAPAGPTLAERVRGDPALLMRAAGLDPDPWQERLLRTTPARTLLLCSRQSGKSLTAAALALRTALLDAPALVLIIAPTQRQSGELFRKVHELYSGLVRPADQPHRRTPFRPVPLRGLYRQERDARAGEALVRATALQLEMANGSRIVSLPGKEGSIRSYSAVRLLILDEAARTPDALYLSLRPMLAVSGGSLVALSSAWAKAGWFYEAWDRKGDWHKVRVTAHQCPRIAPEFLREEEQALGPRWFGMEYLCEFGDAVDAFFRQEDIDAALCCDDQPFDFGISP
jgi:hypothetical protein